VPTLERETQNGAPLRRMAGWMWLTGWALVLYLFVTPWSELGGLVSERLRWLEWFVLGTAFMVGCTVGGTGRDAARPGTGRTHATLLRRLLYPPAAGTAVALLVLKILEEPDVSGVVVTGFLAYWAGFDIAFAAFPLMHGEPYRYDASIDPEPDPPSDPNWTPPEERYW